MNRIFADAERLRLHRDTIRRLDTSVAVASHFDALPVKPKETVGPRCCATSKSKITAHCC